MHVTGLLITLYVQFLNTKPVSYFQPTAGSLSSALSVDTMHLTFSIGRLTFIYVLVR